jgi:hypothetical protein
MSNNSKFRSYFLLWRVLHSLSNWTKLPVELLKCAVTSSLQDRAPPVWKGASEHLHGVGQYIILQSSYRKHTFYSCGFLKSWRSFAVTFLYTAMTVRVVQIDSDSHCVLIPFLKEIIQVYNITGSHETRYEIYSTGSHSKIAPYK